jgi:hypothetical protein
LDVPSTTLITEIDRELVQLSVPQPWASLGSYWEKLLSTAQGRYLKAIETLAKVRRLSKVTPLQVNIGGQQINVAKSSSTE